MTRLSRVSLALCLTVAGTVSLPTATFADHHESESSLAQEAATAPARPSTDAGSTLSVEGTGIQEVEAAARSAIDEGTESVEGTGVMRTGTDAGDTLSVEGTGLMQTNPAASAAAGTGDGTESVEGTGLMQADPDASVAGSPGDGTESVEGTGLMDANSPPVAPASAAEATSIATPAVTGPDEPEDD